MAKFNFFKIYIEKSDCSNKVFNTSISVGPQAVKLVATRSLRAIVRPIFTGKCQQLQNEENDLA